MQRNLAPKPGRMSSILLPDAQWIRKEISVADVARKLGLPGDGRVFDCFREDHPRGKRRRALSVHAISNTVRCFDCDKRSLSNIDLVMQVRGCKVGDAVRWIAENFSDRSIPKVRPGRKGSARRHVGRKIISWQDVARSPQWAKLSSSAKVIWIAIVSRVPAAGSQDFLKTSYSELKRWTGITSDATIAKKLRELCEAGAIRIALVPTGLETRRGLWMKQLCVTLTHSYLLAQKKRAAYATGLSLQKLKPQYALQKMKSGDEGLQAQAVEDREWVQ